jgi:signal transduction histidine kinase
MSELERARFQIRFGEALERIDDPIKLYKTAVAMTARFLGAVRGAVILRHAVSGALQTHGWGSDGRSFDEETVRAFLDLKRPEMPASDLMAPIVMDGRAAGLMALRRDEGAFVPGDGRFLAELTRKLALEVSRREALRLERVVEQIKERTIRDLRPQDLFYQVLHGLRTLVRYDHSSALLIAEDAHLVLHAEQIAWAKGKSRRIGKRVKVPEDLRAVLRRPRPPLIWSEPADEPLARLLTWGGRGKEPREGTLLIAPLFHDDGLLGVLKIAAQRPGAFGRAEAAAVARVLPHVASVIHLSRRALSMEERILAAEKKHAMADLARAISHDVKNAIGAILPLAQQAREEVEAGTADPKVLAQDLLQMEQSARICQRIFDGMLQLARSGVRPPERAPLSKILHGPIAILGPRLRRSDVVLELRLAESLPEVNASRGGLEQLFLNLFTNAIDAMPAGGRLRVTARDVAGGRIEVKVQDTGTGIPPEQLARIHEPFYTTKDEGFGLGLAISRSIVWESDGEMKVESAPGRGTTVTVLLPAARPQPAPNARTGPGAGAAPAPARPRPSASRARRFAGAAARGAGRSAARPAGGGRRRAARGRRRRVRSRR